jgi:glycosyltransferase involved in cell wall biosynthesis
VHIAIEASTWINPRGYGRFTRELTRSLLRATTSHTFTLVVDSGAAAAPDLPPVPTVVVPTRQAVSDAASANGSRSIADIMRVAYRLSRGFDAILFPTSYSFVPVAPGPMVAVVVHDTMPEAIPELVMPSKKARVLWNAKSRLMRWRADLVATVSTASADGIARHLQIAHDRIAVLTEGASSSFSPQPQSDDERRVMETVGGSGRYVLYVGGLSPHKRVPDLVRAFGRAAVDPQLRDVRLAIAGPVANDSFATDRSGVADAIAALGTTGSRVVQTGYVDDPTLAALYRRAECAVLPSRMEGFGLPALEAMSSGTPLVVARNRALEEVCGSAAEYVDDMAELAPTLRRLLIDDNRRQELRRAGLERAMNFGWDEAARRLLAAFDAAC